MNNAHKQAKERLAAYRSEADIRRQLPKNLWRVRLAHTPRAVAARLERPLPPTLHDEWHIRGLEQID